MPQASGLKRFTLDALPLGEDRLGPDLPLSFSSI